MLEGLIRKLWEPLRERGRLKEDLAKLNERIARQRHRIKRLRESGGALKPRDAQAYGINPENMVWIFGSGRTGSSWLSRMMGELEGHTVWFEPWVGLLFDPYHLRLEDRKGQHFILSPRYKSTWLGSVRTFVMDGARARFPELGPDDYLIIKDPGGSVGAPLLMEALAESRMVLLIRDPRDVTASSIDANREGGWRYERRANRGNRPRHSDFSLPKNQNAYAARRATAYLKGVGKAKQAYDAHRGRKALIRYEDLRADAFETLKRTYSELEIEVDERELERAVEKHSWENIPEEEKGEGKFFRKASPGGWRDDLTPEQARIVEEITRPLLKEFYP